MHVVVRSEVVQQCLETWRYEDVMDFNLVSPPAVDESLAAQASDDCTSGFNIEYMQSGENTRSLIKLRRYVFASYRWKFGFGNENPEINLQLNFSPLTHVEVCIFHLFCPLT
jgi:hypothetical protein